jgi:transcription-repair coupling factor (superfamily II helicase)
MRDLEIRGAGDIIGTRQHGQIAAVGFHLYTRMLSQAVTRLKSEYEQGPQPAPSDGGAVAPVRETVTIDLPIPTYVPTDYVPDTALRIQLYRRMADLDSDEAINALGAELGDRFGPMPEPVENLLFQLRVKRRALGARVDAIVSESNQISLRMGGLAYVDRIDLQMRLGHNVRVSRSAIWLPRDGAGGQDWKTALLEVLADLESLAAQTPARTA